MSLYDRSTVEEFCDGSTPSSGWRPSSFVSLLDFNNLELSDKEEMLEPTGQQVCVEGEIYDAWTVCILFRFLVPSSSF